MATAGSYTDSAHGNTSDGVNRLDVEYPIGGCAHCHDPNGPDACVNELMLFAPHFTNQANGFCMECHRGAGNSVQVGGNINTDFDYSHTRGGEISKTCPKNIKKAFYFINKDTRTTQTNCGSSVGSAHDLTNIRNQMKGIWGWGDTNAEVNPCCTCHNPHRQTSNYPCALPSGHQDIAAWEIWGDDASEKMSNYTDYYQPPNNERDASTQPEYNTLCLECHSTSRNSKEHGSVLAIDWNSDVHGRAARSSFCNWGAGSGPELYQPYDDAIENYVLCCTDCHEPHGSRNRWLLRTCVNGKTGIEFDGGYWWEFCGACHTDQTMDHAGPEMDCWSNRRCHGHGISSVCDSNQKSF